MLPSWGRSLRADQSWEEEEHSPGGFPAAGDGGDGASRPRGRGRGAVGAGAGLPGWLRGPARRPPAARRGAALLPGGRCILRVSTRGCGRKEGIRPLHTSPLVRHAHSLALSLLHTRAHSPPRLPLSLPLSLGSSERTPEPDLARILPLAGVPRCGPGCSPAAPRGKSARRPREDKRSPPGKAAGREGSRAGERRARRGAGSGATAEARPSRAPSPAGRQGLSHVQTFPGAEPSPATSRPWSRGPCVLSSGMPPRPGRRRCRRRGCRASARGGGTEWRIQPGYGPGPRHSSRPPRASPARLAAPPGGPAIGAAGACAPRGCVCRSGRGDTRGCGHPWVG